MTSELMDDHRIVGARLRSALGHIRLVNRFLGGYAATMEVLAPLLLSAPDRERDRLCP